MNKRPTIVIDLDNTLAASAEGFVAFSNAHFGTSITIEDYDEDREKTWGVSFEEAERRLKIMRDSDSQSGYLPLEGAREVLSLLKPTYRLVVLTSRRKESEESTMDWLSKYYDGIFEEVFFSGFFEAETARGGHLLTKGEQYRQLDATYVIDDYAKHCLSANDANARAILIGNYPWNRSAQINDNIVRCSDWVAVRDHFDLR